MVLFIGSCFLLVFSSLTAAPPPGCSRRQWWGGWSRAAGFLSFPFEPPYYFFSYWLLISIEIFLMNFIWFVCSGSLEGLCKLWCSHSFVRSRIMPRYVVSIFSSDQNVSRGVIFSKKKSWSTDLAICAFLAGTCRGGGVKVSHTIFHRMDN